MIGFQLRGNGFINNYMKPIISIFHIMELKRSIEFQLQGNGFINNYIKPVISMFHIMDLKNTTKLCKYIFVSKDNWDFRTQVV